MKLLRVIKTVLIAAYVKLRYLGSCQIPWVNSIKGNLDISVGKGGKLYIKKFLISNGPLYLRASDNAELNIGSNTFFNHNCSVTAKESICIGDNTIIANNVVIVDHDHLFNTSRTQSGYSTSPIKIGNNVWIGANSVILKDVNIGDNSVIAAGSVVNKSIPAKELWGGVPAKCIRKL